MDANRSQPCMVIGGKSQHATATCLDVDTFNIWDFPYVPGEMDCLGHGYH